MIYTPLSTFSHRTSTLFPHYFVLLTILWSILYYISPRGHKEKVLGLFHGLLTTVTSLICIFRGDDTAFSCSASVAFFLVDMVGMMGADGFISLPGDKVGGDGKGEKSGSESKEGGKGGEGASFAALRTTRKMDYAHHILGVVFGTVQHYYESHLCPTSIGGSGCAFVFVQWNEISTPFYNLYRITHSPLIGAVFAVTFFLSRVVGNTLWVIPLLYTHCHYIMSVPCTPYFLLQYMWFYMIVKKMRRQMRGKDKGGGKKEKGGQDAGTGGEEKEENRTAAAAAAAAAAPLEVEDKEEEKAEKQKKLD